MYIFINLESRIFCQSELGGYVLCVMCGRRLCYILYIITENLNGSLIEKSLLIIYLKLEKFKIISSEKVCL